MFFAIFYDYFFRTFPIYQHSHNLLHPLPHPLRVRVQVDRAEEEGVNGPHIVQLPQQQP